MIQEHFKEMTRNFNQKTAQYFCRYGGLLLPIAVLCISNAIIAQATEEESADCSLGHLLDLFFVFLGAPHTRDDTSIYHLEDTSLPPFHVKHFYFDSSSKSGNVDYECEGKKYSYHYQI